MKYFLDTNILFHLVSVNSLTETAEVKKVMSIIEDQSNELVLDGMVLFEFIYTLKNKHDIDKETCCIYARKIMNLKNLYMEELDLWKMTVDIFRNNNLDFVDAFLLARVRADPTGKLLSFDKKLISFE